MGLYTGYSEEGRGSMRTLVDAALPGLTSREEGLIERADALGRGVLARNATAVDRGTLSVAVNLRALAEAGLAGVTVPTEAGGAGAGPAIFHRVLEGLCYGDGTTPFVIAQHYGVVGMIVASPNERLKALLPRMATGELFCGFGISHLRRTPPVLSATPYGAGYRLDGAVPWMTGYGLFSRVIIGGTLPDGQSLLAWTPFEESEELRIDPPMELVAMNGARTVSGRCEGLVVRPEDVVSIDQPQARAGANRTAVPCLYGIARACVDDLDALAERRAAPAYREAAARLRDRLDAQRPRFYALFAHKADETAVAEARAAATTLALDAVGALTVATAGGANAIAHPAQRRLREASVFATWGLATEAANVAVAALSAGA